MYLLVVPRSKDSEGKQELTNSVRYPAIVSWNFSSSESTHPVFGMGSHFIPNQFSVWLWLLLSSQYDDREYERDHREFKHKERERSGYLYNLMLVCVYVTTYPRDSFWFGKMKRVCWMKLMIAAYMYPYMQRVCWMKLMFAAYMYPYKYV